MNPRVVLVALILLLSSYAGLTPVHGASPPQGSVPNRVIVGFWNNTSAQASYVSSKYHLPILLWDEGLSFAEYSPQDMNTFIRAVKKETNVRYAYSSLQSCTMTCGSGGGSGGGGGGGTSSSPDFSLSASPSYVGVLASSGHGESQISLTSINKFFGTVSLSSSASPSGLANLVSPSTVYV